MSYELEAEKTRNIRISQDIRASQESNKSKHNSEAPEVVTPKRIRLNLRTSDYKWLSIQSSDHATVEELKKVVSNVVFLPTEEVAFAGLSFDKRTLISYHIHDGRNLFCSFNSSVLRKKNSEFEKIMRDTELIPSAFYIGEKRYELLISPLDTILALRERIESQIGSPLHEQNLFYGEHKLEEGKKLRDYGVFTAKPENETATYYYLKDKYFPMEERISVRPAERLSEIEVVSLDQVRLSGNFS